MSLHDEVEADLQAIFNNEDLGRVITFSSGTTAIGLIEYLQESAAFDLSGNCDLANLYLRKNDGAGLQRYNTITVGSDVWRIERIFSADDHIMGFMISKDRRIA